jgi:hypothetical protein
MKITPNLNYEDVIYSATARSKGIDNNPNDEQKAQIVNFANFLYEPLHTLFPHEILKRSGFRSEELNKEIGGAKNSQHMALNGFAMDLDTSGNKYNKLLFDTIRTKLIFDQLIWEFGSDDQPEWIHVSYNKNKNRAQILRAIKTKQGTVYLNW